MKEVIDHLLGMAFCIIGIAYIVQSVRRKDTDEAGSERSLITALLFMLLSQADAQDSRWRLIQGTDSIIAVPLGDLRIASGYRIAKNIQARQCAWELVQRDKEVGALRSSIESKDKALALGKELTAMQGETITDMGEQLRKANKKLKRRKPWLWFALGAGSVVILQNVLSK